MRKLGPVKGQDSDIETALDWPTIVGLSLPLIGMPLWYLLFRVLNLAVF